MKLYKNKERNKKERITWHILKKHVEPVKRCYFNGSCVTHLTQVTQRSVYEPHRHVGFCFIIVVETYFHTCRRRSSDTLAVFGLAPLNAVDLVQHALLSRPQLVVGGQRERSILRDPDGCRWSQRLRSHHLPNSAPLLWTDRQNGLPEKRRPGGKIKSAPTAVTAALSIQIGCSCSRSRGGITPPWEPRPAGRVHRKVWCARRSRERQEFHCAVLGIRAGGAANVALLKIENRELKTKQTTVQEHVQPV